MRQTSVINDLLSAITDTTGLFAERRRPRRTGRDELGPMLAALLAGRGEASSLERAKEFLAAYRDLDSAGRTFVFRTLAAEYGADRDALEGAARAYLDAPGEAAAKRLHRASEPRRMEIFRRLNQVQGGTQALVAMRLEVRERMAHHADLWTVDEDLATLFAAWFNRGFLVLKAINWQTSAAVLEKIIRYEAVHAINGWDDLRLRIDVPDRHLYAFFHPRLGDEPLIFVEVALTTETPTAIGPILEAGREAIDPRDATHATFYSISNCQDGLKGISFGAFLIKQVAETLAAELPNIKTFVTLSPVPGFSAWLRNEATHGDGVVDEATASLLAELDDDGAWLTDPGTAKAAEAALMPLLAHYLVTARDAKGRMIDPVARFHLGNGARLEQLNWAADRSDGAMRRSHGLMVNYRYELADVEKNHEAYVNAGTVAASSAVARLARSVRPARKDAPEPKPTNTEQAPPAVRSSM